MSRTVRFSLAVSLRWIGTHRGAHIIRLVEERHTDHVAGGVQDSGAAAAQLYIARIRPAAV